MKISCDGAPILNGRGLEIVKQKIEKAFESARSTPMRQAVTVQSRPVVASQRQNITAAVRHSSDREAHFVLVPTESAAELFALCERSINRLNRSTGTG
jgi:hypothetical protein